jgi:molecular chaperone DnaJ
MAAPNLYHILQLPADATAAEVKQAYRRLAKQFHPDSHNDTASHEQIVALNAAYEVLSDPERRQSYDRQRHNHRNRRVDRTAAAQEMYNRDHRDRQRHTGELSRWLQRVYGPVDQIISSIINPLDDQIDDLAADPFDDDLMDDFLAYIEDCRAALEQAQALFRSQPNPPQAAATATHLYYCLNHLGDGLLELEWFTSNYDHNYLHTGQEFFRIADHFRQAAAGRLPL